MHTGVAYPVPARPKLEVAMRDLVHRYHHRHGTRVSRADQERLREVDRSINPPTYRVVRPRARIEACAFVQCGNCGENAVAWCWADILRGVEVRKCTVCSSEKGFTRNGHPLAPKVRIHGESLTPLEALAKLSRM